MESVDAVYNRGLSGETDVYAVVSGPKSRYGGGLALSYIEVAPGVLPTEIDLSKFEGYDPEPPVLLSNEALQEKLDRYKAAQARQREQDTEEFEALNGVEISKL
jgi:hypothetical protein